MITLELNSSSQELNERFYSLQTPHDVADLLEISFNQLVYYLYRLPPNNQYEQFHIKKKTGGTREIHAPISPLKIIQRKLNQVLASVYEPKPSVHGFVSGKSIISNVEAHLKKRRRRYVLNLDLEDFFPSINFGRVRGLFIAMPYNCSEKVATILAQICCYNGILPQGAPTSPIVSNMICGKMDSELQRIAKHNRCYYTRYADDITFSTSISHFPRSLAYFDHSNNLQIGKGLRELIEGNGFEINYEKLRLQSFEQRQEITGLTTNVFPNVSRRYMSQLRAMLHAWGKYGLENAESEYHLKYFDGSLQNPEAKLPQFKKVVRGKIEFLGFVRGKQDRTYRRFATKYAELSGDKSFEPSKTGNAQIFISYSSTDKEIVHEVAKMLDEQGARIWIDQREIFAGANWANEIHNGLEVCNVMLLFVSPDSMKSSNVEDEWQYFHEEKKPIIPIVLKEARMHFQLRRLQYINVQGTEVDIISEKIIRELGRQSYIIL